MLLFEKRFHEGLVRGDVTLTYRLWPTARVKPGGRYRCHPIGVLEVDAIERVTAAAISDSDARRAGFGGRAELLAYLEKRAGKKIRAAAELFRVALRYGGDGDRVPEALDADLTDEEASAIARRLEKLDASSPVGPWTRKTLALIGKHPRVAASKLADRLRRPKLELKADIRKLKRLGLTQSFEVGYEISPRGRAYLERFAKRR
jgi:hypothetical protein